MYCPNCGQQIQDNSKFCPGCGSQLGAAQQQSSGAPQPETQGQQEPIQQTYQQPAQSGYQPAYQQQAYQQPAYQQPYQQPFQQPAKARKKTGCLIGAIVAVVLVAALIIALLLGGGSCSITSARLTDAAMASSVDPETLEPIKTAKSFSPDTAVIYATALLKNAPEGTLVTAEWYYVTDDIDIASVDLESTETTQYVSFSLSRPDNGFPEGDYTVTLYLDGEEAEVLKFTVK